MSIGQEGIHADYVATQEEEGRRKEVENLIAR